MTLPTREMGDVTVLTINELPDGKWESEWEPLRGTHIGGLFSVVFKSVIDHALHRYSKPLVDALGIPPEGALRKIPPGSRECLLRRRCPFYDKAQCHPRGKKMPWCFEPEEIENEAERLTATKAIQEWRQGVYLVIVQGDPNG